MDPHPAPRRPGRVGRGSGASAPAALPAWLPDWVGRLDMPVWICDPSGRTVHMNSRACSLLGISDWVGRPCHSLVGGVDEHGRRLCRADCSVRAGAQGTGALQPLTMRVRQGTADAAWTIVMVIPSRPPDGGEPWLVHCAFDLSREHEFEQYLEAVASRSVGASQGEATLTPREHEILDLLAHDNDAQAIATRLHISYVTVRNHIRNLLQKLGVHSIEEAVARHLLDRRIED